MVRASSWDHPKSPYETLELERDADDDQIKIAYRQLAKFYHPDGMLPCLVSKFFSNFSISYL